MQYGYWDQDAADGDPSHRWRALETRMRKAGLITAYRIL
jgi:hypothetical protein